MKHDLQAEFWKLLKYSGRSRHSLSGGFSPHSKWASRCRWDGQEVRQHTFWMNSPWPFLGYLFLKDIFKGVVDQNMGYVNTSVFSFSDCWFEQITCCFDVYRQSGWLLLCKLVVLSWAGGVSTVNLLTLQTCSPDRQSRLAGQGWCVVITPVLVTFKFWFIWGVTPLLEQKNNHCL